MSTNRHALVHKVIPYMDILTEHLARFKEDRVLHPVVRAASERGIEVINQYYSKTDQSAVYRIAMSMAFQHYPISWANSFLFEQSCIPHTRRNISPSTTGCLIGLTKPFVWSMMNGLSTTSPTQPSR